MEVEGKDLQRFVLCGRLRDTGSQSLETVREFRGERMHLLEAFSQYVCITCQFPSDMGYFMCLT